MDRVTTGRVAVWGCHLDDIHPNHADSNPAAGQYVPAEVADKLLQAVQELRVLVEDIASDEEMDGEAGTVLRRAEDAVKYATQQGEK